MQKLTFIIGLAVLFTPLCGSSQNNCIQIQPNPLSSDPAFGVFSKYVEVFGVRIFATSTVSDDDVKHTAAIMYEYLDNDEDGNIDDPPVVTAMVNEGAAMVMWNTDGEASQNTFFNNYNGNEILQDLYGDEVHPQGSSLQDGFDATLEEVLHLITNAGYVQVYPNAFGDWQGTLLCNAMDTARGGYFTSIPNPYPAGAWYTYDDQTCDYSCMSTEYFYWALTSILGAQDYPGRLQEIDNEWDLNTNALVQSGDVLGYALMTDPQYQLPTVLPNGDYCPVTGIDESKSFIQFDVYPNPATKQLTVTLSRAKNNTTIMLYNALGALVMRKTTSSKSTQLNINVLKQGIYFLKVENTVKKVVIQ